MPSDANSPALRSAIGNADAHRSLPRQAGDRHQPAHALRDLVEAGPVGVGAGLAEAGNAGIDEARIDLGERLVVDPEPLLHVGAEILHHDIGLLHHALEGGEPFGRLQVERHAALVAMQVLEVGALARPAHRLFQSGRRLDLDDIGAPVGELAHAGRSRAHAGQIEHREARKRFRSMGKRHCWRLQRLNSFSPADFFSRYAGRAKLPRSHRHCLPARSPIGRSFRSGSSGRLSPSMAIFPALSGGDHERGCP